MKGQTMVNVNNYKNLKIPVPTHISDRLDKIFDRQFELMEKYHEIEADRGFRTYEPGDMDLHNRFHQAKLKDMAWRVTEELTEATEATQVHQNIPDHFFEEMADAYHFLVELTILSRLTPREIVSEAGFDCKLEDAFDKVHLELKRTTDLRGEVYNIIEALGMAMNCLKNKPWKQEEMLTDKIKYQKLIVLTHMYFFQALKYAGMGADDLYIMYFKKSEVNKFRQRSNY